MPATLACPESGRDSVARILTAVDFPAPFGPSNAKTVPACTLMDSPSERTDAWLSACAGIGLDEIDGG